ncbi:MAG TPA: peptide-methionine (S)-S-oxide reductase [Bryobacterales bacterium]|nr:peptide-methionine (S)-S-oxide reductase [Bryobacterales bacterium]
MRSASLIVGGVMFVSLASESAGRDVSRPDSSRFPDPKIDLPARGSVQTAVLAGGCFWCTEAVFEELAGVKEVVSGYAGGTAETANYQTVSTGRTDHAEAVRITYDPSKITYGQLLKVFFSVAHDPTQLNRQGPDWGPQYRSTIFYADEEQKRVAEAYIDQLTAAGVFSKPIVTTLEPLGEFYPAEDYHQDFCRRNPDHGYVVINALPKIEKVRTKFPGLVKR